MRWTALFLLVFCLPLSAGDRSRLQEAIRAFASDEFEARQAATRTVRELLEKEFAPLIRAMRSEDPEVARRSREVVAGLIPHRKAEEAGAVASPVNGPWGQVIRLAGNNRVQVFVRGRNGAWVIHNQSQKHAQRVNKFGVQGYPCTQTLLRKQLGLAAGRGYVVTKVTRGSAAAQIGLAKDDIVLAVGGRAVMQLESFYRELGKQPTWSDRTIRVLRAGRVITLQRG